MLTNQLKKNIKSLHQLKFRQKYNKFIAEGPKICEEYLVNGKYEIEQIFCNQNWYEENTMLVTPFPGKTIICKDKDLNNISSLKHANKILIVCNMPSSQLKDSVDLGESWALYLDDIRDPGNMGTIIRIADWFGVRHLISSTECVDYYNPKVVQASMGSHNRVEFLVSDFDPLLEVFENTYGLVLDGEDIRINEKISNGLLIIGNEARGISPGIAEKLKYKVRIEGKGGAESLNAAVACGIACHQLLI
ncbi:MAG: RNA methyltransferase [Bacteroidia bacterium]|nr:RNA methyltransferase [Bacteroidia bacterium]